MNMGCSRKLMTARFRIFSLALFAALGGLLSGCINQPQMLPLSRQKPIDRMVVETPPGTELIPIVRGLNCPEAMCLDDTNGALLVSESGIDGREPHIFGYRPDHSYFQIYPWKRTVSFAPTGFVIYGPVTGMVAYQGKIYVAHRDRDGKGVITAFGYDGSHTTILADLPCQGDYGIGDLIVHPRDGRLYFGVGTATNSGVVGLDNYDEGWLKQHPDVHDLMHGLGNGDDEIVLRGYHFFTPNPWAGLFGGSDLAVTGPFQKFGTSILSRIHSAEKPSGAICSVPLGGGEIRVEAVGLHHPRGLAFDEFDRLFAANDGMELRGTRPVYDDPDALVRILTGNVAWYGFPDFLTNFDSVGDSRYAPPVSMIIKSGYPENQPLIDSDPSHLLLPPSPKGLLYGLFPSLSGAAKMAFVPGVGPLKDHQGDIVVALDGDRWPFDTSGVKLQARQGFKIVIVDDSKQVKEFVHNTAGVPASLLPYGTLALERPCDVKFGPDGSMYILDFGRMDNYSAVPRYYSGTGAIFKLIATPRSSRGAASTHP
jgi:hypothetical protein